MAQWVPDPQASAATVAAIFANHHADTPVRIVLIGTDWEVRVWQTMLKIPLHQAVSYATIAKAVCTERATRAVGTAVGKNPLAFVVPCHRVRRSDGGLGGYHWNITRKQAIIGWEAGVVALNKTAQSPKT